MPAKTIEELARHSDLTTTMRYLHLSPNTVKAGIEMLDKSRAEGGSPVTPSVERRSRS